MLKWINKNCTIMAAVTVAILLSPAPTYASSTKEPIRWEETLDSNGIHKAELDITEGVNRYEVFYTKSTELPAMNLATSNGSVFTIGETSEIGDMKVMARRGNDVSGYPDIAYDVIYIVNPVTTGNWELVACLTPEIKEFCIVKTEIPEQWEALKCDYKTRATSIDVYFLRKSSTYTTTDISGFIAADKEIPGANNIKTYERQPEPPKEVNYTPLILAAGTVITIATVVYMCIRKKNEKKRARERKDKEIALANKKIKDKRRAENQNLDRYLSDYDDDEYDDGDDETEYNEEDNLSFDAVSAAAGNLNERNNTPLPSIGEEEQSIGASQGPQIQVAQSVEGRQEQAGIQQTTQQKTPAATTQTANPKTTPLPAGRLAADNRQQQNIPSYAPPRNGIGQKTDVPRQNMPLQTHPAYSAQVGYVNIGQIREQRDMQMVNGAVIAKTNTGIHSVPGKMPGAYNYPLRGMQGTRQGIPAPKVPRQTPMRQVNPSVYQKGVNRARNPLPGHKGGADGTGNFF